MHDIVWLEKQDEYTTIKYKQGDGSIFSLVQGNGSLGWYIVCLNFLNRSPCNSNMPATELQRLSIDWVGINVFFTAKDMTRYSDGSGCTDCGRVGLVSIKSSLCCNICEAIFCIKDFFPNFRNERRFVYERNSWDS